MQTIASRCTLVDLEYLGTPGQIATCLLETGEGLVVVDPGPATTLERLREAIATFGAGLDDVRALLLTHIHLDHAGAAGTLARDLPRLLVMVHERGAPHLADPERLLHSATRLYGDDMDRLWGEVLPVPRDRIHSLAGGERLTLGGRHVRVSYTPGHAWHHVAYLDEETGLAFTGDVLGEQPPDSGVAVPVTPPPDIDVDLMVQSGRRILEWRPERLVVTHFGPVSEPERYAAEHEERLLAWSRAIAAGLEEEALDDTTRAGRFIEQALPPLRDRLPVAQHDWVRPETMLSSWMGLARYWRKRRQASDENPSTHSTNA